MTSETYLLLITAATLGFFHTLLGPDHYLPFIAISKARKWSISKTIALTVLCGFGHVASSILLGCIGIVFGIGISKLEFFESFRGNLAAYAFIIFGVTYLLWSIVKLIRKSSYHSHIKKKTTITPWILFIIFVLGPCEPLIPVLMYPAINSSFSSLIGVITIFTITTILTMVGIVVGISYGINFVKLNVFEKYSHIIASITILSSGILILIGF